jgi:hypothetical protein
LLHERVFPGEDTVRIPVTRTTTAVLWSDSEEDGEGDVDPGWRLRAAVGRGRGHQRVRHIQLRVCKPSPVEGGHVSGLTPEEVLRVVHHAATTEERLMVLLLLLTGVRLGERTAVPGAGRRWAVSDAVRPTGGMGL